MKVLALSIALMMGFVLRAQAPDESVRLLFILDASSSMNNEWGGGSRLDAAKRILGGIIDSLEAIDRVEVALRVYGHQSAQTLKDCRDTRLEVSFRSGNHRQIREKLEQLSAKGITPLAYSLEKCERDFGIVHGQRNVVILITDGEESCDGDPCAISLALQSKGIILKPFVIGLGALPGLRDDLECIGSYYDAQSPFQLTQILHTIVKRTLNKTTAEVDLLDIRKQPTETDVSMHFVNTVTGMPQYEFFHTLNSRGFPDTLELDPINAYDLFVMTTPSLVKYNVQTEAKRHTIIPLNAPQGELTIKMNIDDLIHKSYGDLRALVRHDNQWRTMHVQAVNSKVRYLVDKYDLVLLTLPRVHINDVRVDQSKVTTLQVPAPGMLSIQSKGAVSGGIFLENSEGVLELLYPLESRIYKENIFLQPGNYKVIYKPTASRKMIATVQRNFSIQTGKSVALRL